MITFSWFFLLSNLRLINLGIFLFIIFLVSIYFFNLFLVDQFPGFITFIKSGLIPLSIAKFFVN